MAQRLFNCSRRWTTQPRATAGRPAGNMARTMGARTKHWITHVRGQQAAAGATVWDTTTADSP
eukprot:14077760-Alexandrium_andersonii.AAC.1